MYLELKSLNPTLIRFRETVQYIKVINQTRAASITHKIIHAICSVPLNPLMFTPGIRCINAEPMNNHSVFDTTK